jgi:hypothetical protein
MQRRQQPYAEVFEIEKAVGIADQFQQARVVRGHGGQGSSTR